MYILPFFKAAHVRTVIVRFFRQKWARAFTVGGAHVHAVLVREYDRCGHISRAVDGDVAPATLACLARGSLLAKVVGNRQ